MKSEFRIPTLLGLLVLMLATGAGVYLATQRQIFFSQADVSNAPNQVQIVNLGSSSASILWSTENEVPGFIKAGLLPSGLDIVANDERDLATPQKHRLHFISLTNLQPNTTYYFRIVSGGDEETETRTFTTAPEITSSDYSPLNGAVLDENLQPVPEALVILELPGAQTLATITKGSGNFILPLASIRTEDLTQSYDLTTPTLGTLKVFNLTKSSELEVEVPSSYQPALPAIILGESRSLVPTKVPTPTPDPLTVYDLNGDKKLDDKDRTLIRGYFYSRTEDSMRADFNGDGVVNQTDLSLFNSAASGL